MTPDSNERSLKQTQEEMAEEADRMQSRLDELAEHTGEAEKKADVTRQYTDPDADEPLGDGAGDWEDTASTDDDPAGAVDERDDSGR
jgi:hypothetical protein